MENKSHSLILESGVALFMHMGVQMKQGTVKCKKSHLFHVFDYDIVIQERNVKNFLTITNGCFIVYICETSVLDWEESAWQANKLKKGK